MAATTDGESADGVGFGVSFALLGSLEGDGSAKRIRCLGAIVRRTTRLVFVDLRDLAVDAAGGVETWDRELRALTALDCLEAPGIV